MVKVLLSFCRNRYNTIRIIDYIDIESPTCFILKDNEHTCPPTTLPRFTIKLISNDKHPYALITTSNSYHRHLAYLKNKITPIYYLWTSHIKQYLNDSEFVYIQRNGKSLSYGTIDYGRSIINYDEDYSKMNGIYNNNISQSHIFSRAYFKLWEILSLGILYYKKDYKIIIGCVAEGPGGFIHALADFRRAKHSISDSYCAITLKIDSNTRNAKDWNDQRAKKCFRLLRNMNLNNIVLSYGSTGTGDLLKPYNADYFANKDLSDKKCYLVTGDGGIECIGDKYFEYQYLFNAKLFFGEIFVALKIQQIGGKFILKIYDCSFLLTRQLLQLLAVCYTKVTIVKPVTSRPGNSEKYLLCEGYTGITAYYYYQLRNLLIQWTGLYPNLSYFSNPNYVTNILYFPQLYISGHQYTILKNIYYSNEYFLHYQATKLQYGLDLVEKSNADKNKISELLKMHRYKQQMSYAYAWCKKYGLSTIPVNIITKKNNIDEYPSPQVYQVYRPENPPTCILEKQQY